MKKIKFLSVAIILSTVFAVSCNKDDNNSLSEEYITEEVADDIAASLGTDNSGLSSEITDVAELSDTYNDKSQNMLTDTLYSVDTSFSITNPEGTLITYSYTYHMEYGYVLSDNKLDNIYYNGDVNGSFDAPRIGSSDNRTSNWIMTGLDVSSSEYNINGTSQRNGSSQSKIRNKSTINTTSQISVSNVKVNKSTLMITEGTLNYQLSGDVNGQSFNYSAIVTYSGNGEAELSINGMNYTINITTGEIEE